MAGKGGLMYRRTGTMRSAKCHGNCELDNDTNKKTDSQQRTISLFSESYVLILHCFL